MTGVGPSVRWVSSFVLAHATETVATLRQRLADSDLDVVVIRRLHRRSDGIPVTYFYAYRRDELDYLATLPADEDLERALSLHEWKSSATATSESVILSKFPDPAIDWRAVLIGAGMTPRRVGFGGPQSVAEPGDALALPELGETEALPDLWDGRSRETVGETRGRSRSSAELVRDTLARLRDGAFEGLARSPEGARGEEGATANGGPGVHAEEPAPDLATENAPAGEAAGSETGRSVMPDTSDPPRSAYGLIAAKDRVVEGEELEVVVGLAKDRQPGVAGGPLDRPPSSVGPYALDVQVSADGFQLRAGESWRTELEVTAAAPYPSVALHLRADLQDEPVVNRLIKVKYAIRGQPIGMAVRSVAVVDNPALLQSVAVQPQDSSVRITVPSNAPVADLTVTITVADPQIGRLGWSFNVAPGIQAPVPQATIYGNIGGDTLAFAQTLMNGMNLREGKPGVYQYLLGTARAIGRHMPDEFWTLYRSVAAEVTDRPPTILLLTEEPHVPWEVAAVPTADPLAEPTFLGAVAAIGRWVLDLEHGADARPQPVPPSPPTVRTIAVISGDYSQRSGWSALKEATIEATNLKSALSATEVNAETVAVLSALDQGKPAEVFHFACHGVFDPNSVLNGLYLADGMPLAPQQVMGITLRKAPFVFLNACQVGQAARVLGDYAGMAQAFLFAGACGVIAPIWSITDTIAREIAERFYTSVFAGESPAERLRQERLRMGRTAAAESGTWMAYIYYGHPQMRLKRN